jgi:hypothetical protein
VRTVTELNRGGHHDGSAEADDVVSRDRVPAALQGQLAGTLLVGAEQHRVVE